MDPCEGEFIYLEGLLGKGFDARSALKKSMEVN